KRKEKERVQIEHIKQLLVNTQIELINLYQETQIPEVKELWTEEWLLEVSHWKKIIQRKIVSNTQQEAQKEIIEKVEARFGMIDKEERKMINSILEKPWRRILIDKVIIQDTESKDTKILLTESDEDKKA